MDTENEHPTTPNVEVNIGDTENTAVAPESPAPASDSPTAAPDVPNIPEPSEAKGS